MPGTTTKYRNWTKRKINMGGFFKSKQKLGIILLQWQKHIFSKIIKRMEPGSTRVPGRAPDKGWARAGHVPCSASRGLRFPGAGVTGQLSWMLGTERWARFLRHLIYACVYIYVHAMAWLWGQRRTLWSQSLLPPWRPSNGTQASVSCRQLSLLSRAFGSWL